MEYKIALSIILASLTNFAWARSDGGGGIGTLQCLDVAKPLDQKKVWGHDVKGMQWISDCQSVVQFDDGRIAFLVKAGDYNSCQFAVANDPIVYECRY